MVQAHSTDKTAEIVEQFAKILMTNIGGEQYTGSLRSLSKSALGGKTLLTVQFDPFDVGDFGSPGVIAECIECQVAKADRAFADRGDLITDPTKTLGTQERMQAVGDEEVHDAGAENIEIGRRAHHE